MPVPPALLQPPHLHASPQSHAIVSPPQVGAECRVSKVLRELGALGAPGVGRPAVLAVLRDMAAAEIVVLDTNGEDFCAC